MKIEHRLPPAGHPLRPYVHSIWSLRAGPAERGYSAEVACPKGVVDLFFNLAETGFSVTSAREGTHDLSHRCVLQGVQTAAQLVQPRGEVHLVGISLHAGSCAALLPLPVHEATDRLFEGDLVLEGMDRLWQRLGDTPDFDARCRLLLDWLMQRFQPKPQAGLVRRACRTLREAPEHVTIGRLARDLHLSERHLRRLVLAHVGVAPGEYARLSRFVRALYLMQERRPLTRIAHAAGYADQAHYCRDFRAMTGLTPGEYRGLRPPVPGHLLLETMSESFKPPRRG